MTPHATHTPGTKGQHFIESVNISIQSDKRRTEPPQDGKHLAWGKWKRIYEEDGSTVAYCPDIVTARLIAAAPAMLEALTLAHHLLLQSVPQETEHMETIRAALAKAEGVKT